MAESLEEIVNREAERAIVQQQSALESLQGRSSTLLVAAALIGGFLGSDRLTANRNWGATEWIAVAAFLVLLVSVLWIVNPSKWTFSHSPTVLLEDFVDRDRSSSELYRHLATYTEKHFDGNAKKLGRRSRAFQVASVALAVELGALVLAARGR